jgi:hypothetical protein
MLGDLDLLRHADRKMAAANPHGRALAGHPHRGSQRHLDSLGSGLADHQVVLAADGRGDRLIHLVAADPERRAVGKAAQRQHRDLSRAASDVDDHGAHRLGNGKARADRRRHRLLDQPHLGRAGVGGGVADRPALHRRRARGDADDDLGKRGKRDWAAVRLVDEVLDHLLGDVEIGDDPVAQRPDRLDVVGCLAHHQLGGAPTALTRRMPSTVSSATTEGSLSTMPLPLA